MAMIPVLRRLRQEDGELEASLGYTRRLSLHTNYQQQQQKKKRKEGKKKSVVILIIVLCL
jgi:hypothetical protein